MSCSGDLSIKRTLPITEEFAICLKLKGPKIYMNHNVLVNYIYVQNYTFITDARPYQ